MKKLIYLPFLLTMFSCSEEDTKELVTSSTEEQQVEAQLTTPIPNGFIILDSTLGDLDKDNIEELVVAYNIEDFDENDEWKNIPERSSSIKTRTTNGPSGTGLSKPY